MDRSPTSGRVILLLTRLVDPTSLGFPKNGLYHWVYPHLWPFHAISWGKDGEGIWSATGFFVCFGNQKNHGAKATRRRRSGRLRRPRCSWDVLVPLRPVPRASKNVDKYPWFGDLYPVFEVLDGVYYILGYIYMYNIHTFMRTTTINKSITIKTNHEQQHLFTSIPVPQTNNLTLVIITF